ncbi:MFS transporter [Amycolatopsis sp. NPDC059021]|uniref:MFS transporter n=1 Tax=Amycolatopsis sp. NPDC059021 TaxID=3346704 RepID=UPI0036702F3E
MRESTDPSAGAEVTEDAAPADRTDGPGRRSLLRQRDFRLFWAGETASVFAGNATGLILPLLAVTVLDSSPLTLGFLAAAVWLPWLLIGLPAGAWVDRLPKRPVMITCNLVSAVLLISVPLAWYAGTLTVAQLLVVALVTGGATVFFVTAYHAYFPLLVGERHLMEGNAKLQGSESAMLMLGPSAGGVITQAFGAATGVLMNAAAHLLSAVCLTRIRGRTPEDIRARPRTGLRAEMRDGLRFVLKDAYFKPIVLYGAMANLALDGYQSIYVAFLIRTVGVNPVTVGVLIAAGGVGGILGAMVVRPLVRRFGTARGFLIGKFVATPFGLLMPVAGDGLAVLFFFAGLFVVDGSLVAGNVIMDSFRQAYCPPELLGRVVATTTFIKYSTIPVGAVLGGFLGDHVGLRPTMWIMTGALVCCTAILLWGPIRRMRDFPKEPVNPGAGAPGS